jgi:hypothetical protein
MRNAELDQFPVELRGLILSLLEGRLRPLERDTLMLEPTQRLFPCQALPLERSLGLGRAARSYWSWVFTCWRSACS